MGWVSRRKAHPVLRSPLRWRGFGSLAILIIFIPNSGMVSVRDVDLSMVAGTPIIQHRPFEQVTYYSFV